MVSRAVNVKEREFKEAIDYLGSLNSQMGLERELVERAFEVIMSFVYSFREISSSMAEIETNFSVLEKVLGVLEKHAQISGSILQKGLEIVIVFSGNIDGFYKENSSFKRYLKALVQLTEYEDYFISVKAVVAIGNFISEGLEPAYELMRQGFFAQMLFSLSSNLAKTSIELYETESAIKEITWVIYLFIKIFSDSKAISNLFPFPRVEEIFEKMLECLSRKKDSKVRTYCSNVLSRLLETSPLIVKRFSQFKILDELILSKSQEEIICGLKILGVCLSLDQPKPSETISGIQNETLKAASMCILSKDKYIRVEACWAFSNLVCEGAEMINLSISLGVFSNIVRRMVDCDYSFAIEGLICIRNAAISARNNEKIIDSFLEDKVMEAICNKLEEYSAKSAEDGVAENALMALEAMLELGSTKELQNDVADYIIIRRLASKVEEVQNNPNKNISGKAIEIIQKYFPFEESLNQV